MFNILELVKRLRFRYPLFTTTIEQLDFLEDYGIPTAATDGKCVYYNPKFMMNLTSQQQLFILAHEVSHVALNHMKRLKDRDMKIWNIATDAVINAFLVRDGLTPVEGLIFIDNALEFSSEELYKALTDDQKEENSDTVKGDKDKCNESHQRWNDGNSDADNADNESSEENNTSNKNAKSKMNDLDDNESNTTSGDENQESSDLESTEYDNQLDEREVFNENLKKRLENENNLKKSLNKSKEFSLGNPGFDSPELNIKNVGKKTKLIDWRRLLKEACKYELDYSYKDAQIEDGVLVSHLIEIPSCETEILLDTSGSIDHELLKCFLRECKNILQNSRIKVACFDDKVYNFVTIRTESDLEKMKFKGGGGTNFVAASNGFTNRVDNKIIFTDGYGYVKNPPLDIIWVVFETDKNLPKEAKVIKVDRKKLIKLNSR